MSTVDAENRATHCGAMFKRLESPPPHTLNSGTFNVFKHLFEPCAIYKDWAYLREFNHGDFFIEKIGETRKRGSNQIKSFLF